MLKSRNKSLSPEENALKSLLAQSDYLNSQVFDHRHEGSWQNSKQRYYESLSLKNNQAPYFKSIERKVSEQKSVQNSPKQARKKLSISMEPTNFRKLMNIQFSNKNINLYSLPKISTSAPHAKYLSTNVVKTINFSQLSEKISELSLNKNRGLKATAGMKNAKKQPDKMSCSTIVHKKKMGQFKKRNGYYKRNLIIEQ